jgi:hypothetical protein
LRNNKVFDRFMKNTLVNDLEFLHDLQVSAIHFEYFIFDKQRKL